MIDQVRPSPLSSPRAATSPARSRLGRSVTTFAPGAASGAARRRRCAVGALLCLVWASWACGKESPSDELEPSEARETSGESVAISPEVHAAQAHRDAVVVAELLASWEKRDATALARLGEVDGGDLEDWRLMVLAEHETNAEPRRELWRLLLARRPASPLAPLVRVALARELLDLGESAEAWALLAIEVERLTPPAEALELAWRAAPRAEEQLAVALAVAQHHPNLLREIDTSVLRPESAANQLWREWALAAAPLLAARGRGTEARRLLANLEETAGDFRWRLASAAVELRLRRPAAAMAELIGFEVLLEPLSAPEALEASARGRRLRAEILLALAKAEPQRAEARVAAAVLELERVLADGPAPHSVAAGVELVGLTSGARQVAVINRLGALDPDQRVGPRALFQQALASTTGGEHATALAHWQQLLDHPGSAPWEPAAHYWSARALEELGHTQPARQRFGLAAAGAGFYRHQVAGRLGPLTIDPPASAPESGAELPRDVSLARAELLAEAGAFAIALRELDAHPNASLAARAVLRSEILAATGRVRDAATAVRPAFPDLGPGRLDRVPRAALELYYPILHTDEIVAWSRRRGLDPALIAGMIRQESAFDTLAVSRAGARGLLQLMPPTAREVARRERVSVPSLAALHDPSLSLRLGTSYFAEVLEMFDGTVELALAGYNAGPYRVRRWRRAQPNQPLDLFVENIPLSEPRDYVKRVLQHRDGYLGLVPAFSGES